MGQRGMHGLQVVVPVVVWQLEVQFVQIIKTSIILHLLP
jgi:hypothetical protein